MISALIPIAEKLRAIIVADGPNTNDEEAIKWRKSVGSSRVYVVDPWVKVFEGEEKPASPFVAGLIAKVDSEQGFWHSPSNKEINGIVGTSRPIDFTLGNTNCIANPSKVSPSAKINSRIDIGPKVLQSFSYGMLDGKP